MLTQRVRRLGTHAWALSLMHRIITTSVPSSFSICHDYLSGLVATVNVIEQSMCDSVGMRYSVGLCHLKFVRCVIVLWCPLFDHAHGHTVQGLGWRNLGAQPLEFRRESFSLYSCIMPLEFPVIPKSLWPSGFAVSLTFCNPHFIKIFREKVHILFWGGTGGKH
jgi:hypothetical protein